MKEHLGVFMDELEVWEEVASHVRFRAPFLDSMNSFLDNPCPKTARSIYQGFLDLYWTGSSTEPNPFLELVQMVHRYEEAAGRVVTRQRDHFVHSVHVFLLGLAVFTRSHCLQEAFRTSTSYSDCYTTRHEEFFYRWGFAALFHDVGYPIEIAARQLRQYADFLGSYPSRPVRSTVDIDFSAFSLLETLEPSPQWANEFQAKYPLFSPSHLRDSICLLAHTLGDRLAIEEGLLEGCLRLLIQRSPCEMADHGCYGALAILRWLHHLIESSGWNPAYFYNAVVDSATAILFHTLYPKTLSKPPFSVPRLSCGSWPLAYLLIFCDEVQDWSRPAYGPDSEDQVDGFDLTLGESSMKITYLVQRGYGFDEDTVRRKRASIDALVDVQSVFSSGLVLDRKEVPSHR